MTRTSPDRVVPNGRAAAIVGATMLLTVGAFAVAAFKLSPPDHPASTVMAEGGDVLGHVHGLGVDPADGALYAASHMGVFRLEDDGQLQRVADRWQDTMGFTVVGPKHFLASGHPDLTEERPIHLGLIESRDAALTWKALSLSGSADFHALEASPDRTWGYDSQSGTLLTTTDNQTWRTIAKTDLVDLAADPRDSGRVLATMPGGRLAAFFSNGTREQLDSPDLMLLDWPNKSRLVGAASDGRLYRSQGPGLIWELADGQVPGDVEALEVTKREWYVATSSGIYSSRDEGRSWQLLVDHAG
jgi:photosystem II stability/assembly factor-like uncharacterized protein